MAFTRGYNGKYGKVQQHQKAEGVESIAVCCQIEMRPAKPQKEKRFSDHRDTQYRRHGDKTSDVPSLRFLGWPDVVGGQGYFRKIRHEDEQKHGKRRNDKFAGHHERDGHKGCLQDSAADLVDDPGEYALVNSPSLLDQGDNVCQSCLRKNYARCAFGHISRSADSDADFRLSKSWCVIDAITRHAGHMPRRLQVLHHGIFVFRKHFSESVSPGEEINFLIASLRASRFQVRHPLDVGQPNSLANLSRHRQGVAGEHLYRNAEVVKCCYQLLGIRARRIIQRDQSN